MSSTGLQLKELLKGTETVRIHRNDFLQLDRGTETREKNPNYPAPSNSQAVRVFLETSEKRQRKDYYEQVLCEIHANLTSPECLLAFVKSEPNLKLVQRATRDYLIHRHCSLLDEFGGVKLIVELFEQNALTNPGAVFAGLVSMGDRRVNAVVRLIRNRLSMADISEFSRIHPAELHASSIEFYLDWLIELQQRKESRRFNSVCAAMKLMILHDESGSILDYSEQTQVGFKHANPSFVIRYEDYLGHLKGIFSTLGTLSACREPWEAMTKAWQDHTKIAPALRSVSQHQPYCSHQ